ncbi:protein FAR1-RELATED SEQUENCE 5-like [Phragmites australis]|uniref:protein FAR1-RELATED SEQUENCE 5-like n=1 Tax=Phragmites australis TaxID=29695 RepID=UPI002D7815B7|nr:protein FAR1-RELATED SEQUENCE 5-like [Phragmites australis]
MGDLSAEALLEYEQIVSNTFISADEGFDFYNNYALKKGFSVRKCYMERDKGSKEICLRKFVCSRQGFREAKHMKKESKKRKPRNISRCGCRAKMVIRLSKGTWQWYVKDFIDEHNHPLATPDVSCLLRSHRGISDVQKADIIEMEIAGIRKHQIMNILEMQCGGYDNVGCISRDIYNFCYHYKQKTIVAGDAETVISHLKARQERDADFFFRYLSDDKGHLKGLFWSDSQSRLDYEEFGDVVVFDSTYRTNRYNLPFVPFVGLNHHRSTIIFGCGIISHETSESYQWLLHTFLAAMSQKHPISVITDGDLAMQRAIKIMLPNSNHRLCTWHIEQNIVRNLHNSDIVKEFRKFLYDCCTVQEVERKWDDFIERNQISDQKSWLHQMYQMRNLWCAAYQVGRCFLGLRSNQRSESLNSKLHTHLDGKITLFDMLQHYEHCLSNLRRNEAKLDSIASQSVPFTGLDAANIEKDAAHVFTPTIFALVKEMIDCVSNFVISEILDGGDGTTYIVATKGKEDNKFDIDCEFIDSSLESISCSCRMLECEGIPCGHIFYVLEKILHADKIPKCCVANRWTMSAKSAFPPIRKSSIYDYSQSLERYRDLRNLSHAASFKASQSDASYVHMKRVLNEIVGSNDACNPEKKHMRYGPVLTQAHQAHSLNLDKVLDPVQVKSRGAPKKKRMKAFTEKPKKNKCGHCKKQVWPMLRS